MRRRQFLGCIGAAILAAPGGAGAQQTATRRVGVLMGANASDREYAARLAAFRQALPPLGWIEGKNIVVDVRWGIRDAEIGSGAAELVASKPDVLLANAPPSVLALQKAGGATPIVFAAVTDPVLLGLVQSLAHPGGSITGFASSEAALSSKWFELLKDIAPDLRHVGVFAPPNNLGAQAQIGAIQAAASSLHVEVSRIAIGDPGMMDRSVAMLAATANSGLIASRTVEAFAARGAIIALAAKYRLPAVYPDRAFVGGGGLASYGPDIVNDFRRAAGYVDRILKGAKPADLPVQVPTKYELVINQRTAKALGLTVPASLQATADELIE